MSATNLFEVLRRPLVSEKTARVQERSNQYVFEVAGGASKADVKAAVEKLFNVKVESVQVVNTKAKAKVFRGRPGTRQGARKAYVRISDGQSIDLMAKA